MKEQEVELYIGTDIWLQMAALMVGLYSCFTSNNYRVFEVGREVPYT